MIILARVIAVVLQVKAKDRAVPREFLGAIAKLETISIFLGRRAMGFLVFQ